MLVSRMHPHWVGCRHTLEAGVVGAYDSAVGNFVYDVTTHSLNIKPSLEKHQSQPHCRHAATTSSHSVSLTEDKKLKLSQPVRVVVYAVGTVNPYLIIDAATSIRCAEIGRSVWHTGSWFEHALLEEPVAGPTVQHQYIGNSFFVPDLELLYSYVALNNGNKKRVVEEVTARKMGLGVRLLPASKEIFGGCKTYEEKKNKSSASELLIGGFKPSSWSTGAGSSARKNGS
ncbi:hypothetical protein Tco_0761619 [Tanacetum coccineum]